MAGKKNPLWPFFAKLKSYFAHIYAHSFFYRPITIIFCALSEDVKTTNHIYTHYKVKDFF